MREDVSLTDDELIDLILYGLQKKLCFTSINSSFSDLLCNSKIQTVIYIGRERV